MIVASTVLGGVLAWLAAESVTVLAYAGVFVFVIAGWVLSLSLHEFGHAYTAWRFGDHDVAVRGYLTLNPLKYSSPCCRWACRCCSSRSAGSACRAARCTSRPRG